MKKIITLFIIASVFYSCAISKLAKISSKEVPLKTDKFIFENDTVKITYKFWAEKGQMNFDVYNKLNVPIFIDLKNSSYIPNDKMVSYWQDATNTEAVTTAYSYNYGLGASARLKTKSKTIRQERIIVIAPKSLITNNQYSLIKNKTELKGAGVYEETNSPLKFRNYLALSLNEKFEGNVFYINNSFFVSSIEKIKSADMRRFSESNYFYSPEQ